MGVRDCDGLMAFVKYDLDGALWNTDHLPFSLILDTDLGCMQEACGVSGEGWGNGGGVTLSGQVVVEKGRCALASVLVVAGWARGEKDCGLFLCITHLQDGLHDTRCV